ncbi:hypothetical protein GRI97_15820 [Altererythrobacter xixiisoli]|uniref:Putative tail fiber protein gp53-like C-terminal domain-containing protein n=1 Tax=Croceibacterium xixiisoli TaxID=1476466 RepID=A0A6I4U0R4_9SPHN|nr:hypothetical protein [Croceibacterium xixiisoli]MXP00459.1 hypothetical protein [Croceibacterium xixiisoli]
MALALKITRAGRDALINAEDGTTEPIQIVAVGLSSVPFVMAPTIEALPGEIKRLNSIAGQAIDPFTIHMSAQDSSPDVYDLTGIGFYLADGTLFAVYSQDEPIFRKVSIAVFLMAFDVRFESEIAGAIEMGDATFLYPPATEFVQGVAYIATQAQVDAGEEERAIVTPRTMAVRLAALVAGINGQIANFTAAIDDTIAGFIASVNASLAAIRARTITGSGLATGGGDLTANRIIHVPAAGGADIDAGTAADLAVTPASLRATSRSMGSTGWIRNADGTIEMWGRVTPSYTSEGDFAVAFPTSFPTACDSVMLCDLISSASTGVDAWTQLINNSITQSGFRAQVQGGWGAWAVPVGIAWRAKGR